MSPVAKRTFALTPQRRALLELLLQEEGVESSILQRISRRKDTDSIPLSFAQQRLWFLDQLEPGSPVYNIPNTIRITGALDVAVLEQSFNEIVRRHEALRTSFAAVNGQPFQAIAPILILTLPVIDLRSLPVEARQNESGRLIQEEVQRPFDLAKCPLLRACLLRLSEEEYVLILTLHHIISDDWSINILLDQLWESYFAIASGGRSLRKELPIQYADFAIWQQQWLSGEVIESQMSYWKQQLKGRLPVLDLPTDRPRPAFVTYRGASQSLVISKQLTEAIKTLCKDCGVTLFMTLMAAFKTLLYRYCGQDDIIVGSPIACRNRAEIEDLIGFFINAIVLRTDLSGNPSFRQLLEKVREVALGAYSHPDLPFDKLVEELHPERDLSRNPIFQVWFNLLNFESHRIKQSGLSIEVVSPPQVGSKFDLTLLAGELPEGLLLEFAYNTDLFEQGTIARMLGHLQNLLADIAIAPDKSISCLSLLSESEKEDLLGNFNDNLEEEY